MKSIVGITQRLVSLFLVLVASGMMFLSSPGLAATVTTLNQDNFETEVVNSDKPVVVILALEQGFNYAGQNRDLVLEGLKSKAENFYGNNYKIVVGEAEQNRSIYRPLLRVYPSFPTVSVFEKGQFVGSFDITNLNDPKDQFAIVKDYAENN
jgi:hypothetical protein